MLQIFHSVLLYLGFYIILCIFSHLCVEARESDNDKLDTDPQALVEVRAVLINCRLNDGGTAPDTEAVRFHREELFKHNALKDCNTKLAVVLKLASVPERSSDEYIPIDHVIEDPSKKRIRLLNPYVVRLRWETPLQAYKLYNMDTVTGVVAGGDKQYLEKINAKYKKDRVRRSTHQTHTHQIVNELDDSSRQTSFFTTNHDAEEGKVWKKMAAPYESNIKSGLKGSTDYGNYFNASLLRMKRQERNIIVEPRLANEMLWISNLDHNEAFDGPKISSPVEVQSAPVTVPHRYKDQEEPQQNTFWKKTKTHFDKYFPQGGKVSRNYHPRLKTVMAHSDDTFRDDESFKGKSNLVAARESFRKIHSSSERDKSATNEIDSAEQLFSIYDIGSPDIWCIAHVQLFEKLSTLEGKTVWNDITKGEIASVSSVNQEWRDQDLHVRYRSAEWTSQDQFTLPVATSLCLLIPHSGGDYIIIPTEDVILMTDDVESLKKRNENISNNSTNETTMNKRQRKVMLRVARNLKGGIDNLNVVKHGSEQYLTLPHRRPHRVQIDLETRADDNQLIRVGAYGRLTTVVSDNSRRTRTVFTVQATNTGLAAAKFKLKTRDCGPELSSLIQDNGSGAETDLELIPPRHTKRMSLDLPVELPGDTAHCSVALVNQDDKTVAIRDVTVKRGDRCFCVWHCDCVCLSDDPRLLCREMSESRRAAAGLARGGRRTRALCYSDAPYVDVTAILIGVPLFLLFLGVIKAILGLVFPPIGIWQLDKIVEMPRKLDTYHEAKLANKRVVYDKEGYPVHPCTKERTVRLFSIGTEFILNVVFFIGMPCVLCWCAAKRLYATSESGIRAFKEDKTRLNTVDFQKRPPRMRVRRATLRGWMTPEAEHLSTKVWREGLLPQRSFNCNFMQPLLHEDDSRADATHSTSMDSEQDDTEYVLTQMQKSRESLARTQMMNNNNSPSK